jgi:hypothetical protein
MRWYLDSVVRRYCHRQDSGVQQCCCSSKHSQAGPCAHNTESTLAAKHTLSLVRHQGGLALAAHFSSPSLLCLMGRAHSRHHTNMSTLRLIQSWLTQCRRTMLACNLSCTTHRLPHLACPSQLQRIASSTSRNSLADEVYVQNQDNLTTTHITSLWHTPQLHCLC